MSVCSCQIINPFNAVQNYSWQFLLRIQKWFTNFKKKRLLSEFASVFLVQNLNSTDTCCVDIVSREGLRWFALPADLDDSPCQVRYRRYAGSQGLGRGLYFPCYIVYICAGGLWRYFLVFLGQGQLRLLWEKIHNDKAQT